MTKKEFALKAIAPYYKDPSKCGYEEERCVYLTDDGRRCVAGQYIQEIFNYTTKAIYSLLLEYSQEKVFIPEVVGILSSNEWEALQLLHDKIARIHNLKVNYELNEEDFFKLPFTYQELIDYANTLP